LKQRARTPAIRARTQWMRNKIVGKYLSVDIPFLNFQTSRFYFGSRRHRVLHLLLSTIRSLDNLFCKTTRLEYDQPVWYQQNNRLITRLYFECLSVKCLLVSGITITVTILPLRQPKSTASSILQPHNESHDIHDPKRYFLHHV
jgi:hypothetical protein